MDEIRLVEVEVADSSSIALFLRFLVSFGAKKCGSNASFIFTFGAGFTRTFCDVDGLELLLSLSAAVDIGDEGILLVCSRRPRVWVELAPEFIMFEGLY